MLTDLLCTDNYASFNVKAAHVFGLHTAVYLNEILNITQKAIQKRRLTEGYVTVDRDYVQRRTTLDIAEQLAVDKKLTKVGVLEIAEERPDDIKLNIDNLANLVAAEDAQLLKKVTKLSEVKSVTTAGSKMSQRQRYIQTLKGYITCTNEELLNAYKSWVDGVYANPKGFLSQKAVTSFQRDIDEFAKGDLDLALKVVEIATIRGWKCADWAISEFNKDYAREFYAQYAAPTSAEDRKVELSEEVF